MRETERTTAITGGVPTPSLDLVFEVLADQCRRYALYYLYENDGVATLEEITDHVLQCEDPDEDRRSVVTSLQHVHLPKLEDAGILEYDRRSDTVRYWSQPSLEEWLEHARHKEQSQLP